MPRKTRIIDRSSESITERVVRAVFHGIEDGIYVPGQRLVELDLTRELGVSRTSLREAFQRLSAEGVLEIVQNRGALVRRLSDKDISDIQQIRNLLEPLAASLAAKAMTSKERKAQFRKIAAVWLQGPPVDDLNRYTRENRMFHKAVVAIGGNTQLVPIIDRLHLVLLTAHFRSSQTQEIREISARHHKAICEAILECDAAAAGTLMRQHMKLTTNFTAVRPGLEGRSRPPRRGS